LLFPLVLVVILFVVEFGFALHAHITVNSAAREAARHAAVARLPSFPASVVSEVCDPNSIEERAVDSSIGLILCKEIAVGYVEQTGDLVFGRGDSVVVTVRHIYTAKTPLSALASAFSFGTIPSTFTISACADARLEGAPSNQAILLTAPGDCGTP
jgi:Flp pilus assembly protein TadG